MREIKFKAMTISGNWVEGNLIRVESGQCYIFNRHFVPAKSIPSEWFIEVIPETVSQFIDLTYYKDGRNHNIFEGDAFKITWYEGKEYTCTVAWDNNQSQFLLSPPFDRTHIYDIMTANDCYGFEYTGNIHDTK